jgi:hypothetical protein
MKSIDDMERWGYSFVWRRYLKGYLEEAFRRNCKLVER